MSDFISRDDAIAKMRWLDNEEETIPALRRLPSIDAVPVVRCGECQYYGTGKGKHEYCEIHQSGGLEPTDYCSYGQRRVANDEL